MKFCPPPPRNFWLATPLSKNHPFKSIIDFFSVVNRFRYNKVGVLANYPFYHFWQTIVFVIFVGGPVLILVPGPGLALNGLGHNPFLSKHELWNSTMSRKFHAMIGWEDSFNSYEFSSVFPGKICKRGTRMNVVTCANRR